MANLKDLFGLKLLGKETLSSTEGKKIRKSFVLPDTNDAITVEASAGFFGQYLDLDGVTRTDADLIYKYREMSMHPECESAIDDVVCESIVNEDNQKSIKLLMDDFKMGNDVKEKIVEEFDNILHLLDFQTKGYEIFRRWYVDGKLVYHIIVDEKDEKAGIAEVRYVDPVNIQKVKKFERDKTPNVDGEKIVTRVEEFYIYSKDGFRTGTAHGLKISPDAIVFLTSGLYDSRNKRSVGYMHKAIKALNQLRMIEDAIVIYRLARSPERRVFYVDVGNLPKAQAEEYLKSLMNRHRNKLIYDAATGEMRDDKRHMSMIEDYWMPRREGGKGTEITTLPGAANLDSIKDLEYFQRKLYRSLNVPYSRNQGEQKSFNIGRSTEITRDEVKFSKFINRLRNKFSELFYALLKTQLILKNIIEPEDWEDIRHKLFFDYLKDSFFAELKHNEINNDRMNVLGAMQPYIGKYYSNYWIQKNILGFSDEEILEMAKQMQEEKELEAELQQQQAEFNLQNQQMDPNAQQQMQQGPPQNFGKKQRPFGGQPQEQPPAQEPVVPLEKSARL